MYLHDIADVLRDRGLSEDQSGWPLGIIEAAIHAAQRGWALIAFRPGKVVVENRSGDRITILSGDPVPALRSLPNELVRS